MNKKKIDYSDPEIRKEVFERQKRDLWTPEQIASFAKHFKLKPGMRLLDAGCGYGYNLCMYGPYCMPGGKLIGIDIEDELLETAKKYAEDDGLGNNSKFLTANICNLPFDSNTFDISMTQFVLNNIATPEIALDELIRVTKPGCCIATFETAIPDGEPAGWNNILKPTLKQKLFNYEVSMRMYLGNKKLGLGDYSVGRYLPAWMEARGLKNVDARQNEMVIWFAPPYSSQSQKSAFHNIQERYRNRKFLSTLHKKRSELLRAGGTDEKTIRNYLRYSKRNVEILRDALKKGELAMSDNYNVWCIWGFKP